MRVVSKWCTRVGLLAGLYAKQGCWVDSHWVEILAVLHSQMWLLARLCNHLWSGKVTGCVPWWMTPYLGRVWAELCNCPWSDWISDCALQLDWTLCSSRTAGRTSWLGRPQTGSYDQARQQALKLDKTTGSASWLGRLLAMLSGQERPPSCILQFGGAR